MCAMTITLKLHRGGSACLSSLYQFINGAWRVADYAAARRVVRIVIVHLVRRLAVKRLMRSGLIIEHQLAFQALMRSADRLVGMQIHLLVFDALPESFHKYVIPPAAFSVHADLDAVVFQ